MEGINEIAEALMINEEIKGEKEKEEEAKSEGQDEGILEIQIAKDEENKENENTTEELLNKKRRV